MNFALSLATTYFHFQKKKSVQVTSSYWKLSWWTFLFCSYFRHSTYTNSSLTFSPHILLITTDRRHTTKFMKSKFIGFREKKKDKSSVTTSGHKLDNQLPVDIKLFSNRRYFVKCCYTLVWFGSIVFLLENCKSESGHGHDEWYFYVCQMHLSRIQLICPLGIESWIPERENLGLFKRLYCYNRTDS